MSSLPRQHDDAGLLTVALGQLKEDNFAGMIQALRTIQDPHRAVRTLIEQGQAKVLEKDRAAASASFLAAYELIRLHELGICAPIDRLALLQAWAGLFPEAVRTAKLLPDPLPRMLDGPPPQAVLIRAIAVIQWVMGGTGVWEIVLHGRTATERASEQISFLKELGEAIGNPRGMLEGYWHLHDLFMGHLGAELEARIDSRGLFEEWKTLVLVRDEGDPEDRAWNQADRWATIRAVWEPCERRSVVNAINELTAALHGQGTGEGYRALERFRSGDQAGARAIVATMAAGGEKDLALGTMALWRLVIKHDPVGALDLVQDMSADAAEESKRVLNAVHAWVHIHEPDLLDAGILIVEDEETIRKIWSLVLKNAGYRNVFIAEDGRKALDVVRAQGPAIHVVVTDSAMPVMTGMELVRRLAADHPHPIGIVMDHGMQTDEVLQEFFRLGNDRVMPLAVLAKPAGRAKMLSVVFQALKKVREKRAGAES